MLVLAAIPSVQAHRLKRAAGADFEVTRVSSWDAALTLIRSRPVEIAVVDPLLSGQPREQEIERLRVLFPSLPTAVYTSLTPETAGILLSLGRRGIRHAAFTRYDDHPDHLRALLESGRSDSVAQQLLTALTDVLDPLPAELRWALEAVLTAPTEMQTVGQLASRARVDRRTCERWFARTGITSPRIALASARLLYAHRLLQDPGYTVEDVAQKVGYRQVKTLQQHAREMLGLSPGELRLALTPQDALNLVARHFCRTAPEEAHERVS